jgi:hypothetical protein
MRSSAGASEEQIVQDIVEGRAVSARLTLESFRRVFRLLRNAHIVEQVHWIVVLLGDQAFVQALRRPQVSFELAEIELRHYSAVDFAFLAKGDGTLFGSIHGKLSVKQLVTQTLGWAWVWRKIAALGALATLSYFIPQNMLAKITDATINALAIFMSVFILFVLNVDPDKEFRYLVGGRYSIMAQSDRYIAMIGFAALAVSVLSAGILTLSSGSWPIGVPVLRACVFALSIVLTAASFSLVVQYHFDRKQQMVEIRMAGSLLREVQAQAAANSVTSPD